MASDKRWTGGAANREWQRGSRAEQPVNIPYLVLQVKAYMEDCERFRAILGPGHPNWNAAKHVIFCRNDEERHAALVIFSRAMRARARGNNRNNTPNTVYTDGGVA
jgi:hypothetical protein